jgi:2-oxoisovalerate dehydrogenase E1 component alpha subunit
MPGVSRSPSAGVLNPPAEIASGKETVSLDQCREMHRLMVLARKLEERCIKMSKSGEAYFWVGGPGEEAFNTALGMQVHRGEGPAYDYLHLHYRSLATLLGMGMPVIDHIRQMVMALTDEHSMGRNFVCHYAKREWNVIPVTSVIEVQYSMAPGTAIMQKRTKGDGVSIVVGGDAGSHEGDFATCMIWSTRPGQELPVLMLITNNEWGISTPYDSQHAEAAIIDRGKAFGIPGEVVDGNDAIASWNAIARGMKHCRTQRKPYMIEARLSRLHGHSSSSGAGRVQDELDPIVLLERKLFDAGIDRAELESIHGTAKEEVEEAVRTVSSEPRPTAEHIYQHTYAPSPVDAVYPQDYTGLPN